MNDLLKKILKWAPSHVGILIVGAVVVLLVWYLPERATAVKLQRDLQQQQAAFKSASSAVDAGKLELDKARTSLANAEAANSGLTRELGAAQSTIGSLNSQLAGSQQTARELAGKLDSAQATIGRLTSGVGEIAGGADSAIGLAQSAENAIRSALGIVTASKN